MKIVLMMMFAVLCSAVKIGFRKMSCALIPRLARARRTVKARSADRDHLVPKAFQKLWPCCHGYDRLKPDRLRPRPS